MRTKLISVVIVAVALASFLAKLKTGYGFYNGF